MQIYSAASAGLGSLNSLSPTMNGSQSSATCANSTGLERTWRPSTRRLQNLTRRLAALYPQEAITAQMVDMELNVDAPDLMPAFLAVSNACNVRSPEFERRQTLASAMEHHLAELFHAHGAGLPPPGLYHRILREIEYPVIYAALAATRGNQIRAAELLGLNRN
jgi:two-component system nitrogen regulation response regulator GlnG